MPVADAIFGTLVPLPWFMMVIMISVTAGTVITNDDTRLLFSNG